MFFRAIAFTAGCDDKIIADGPGNVEGRYQQIASLGPDLWQYGKSKKEAGADKMKISGFAKISAGGINACYHDLPGWNAYPCHKAGGNQ